MRLSLTTALLVALLTAVVWPAQATTALKVGDREQASLSTAVVVAVVGSSRVELEPGGRFPVTVTALKVDEVLYGIAPSTLDLVQFGGAWGGQVHAIGGDATLERGERCVLFLRQVQGRWFLTALQQSKYRIVQGGRLGATLERDLDGGLMVRGAAGRLEAWVPPKQRPILLLRQLKEQLRRWWQEAQQEADR